MHQYYKLCIIFIILVIAVYFIYLGYNEKYADYNTIYSVTFGTIINKQIETKDIVEKDKKNALLFKHNKKFRLKITYTYKVDDKKYTGHFYNDGTTSQYLDPEQYILIGKTYDLIRRVQIFYHNNKPHNSCISLSYIKNRWEKLYYIIGVGMLLTLPVVIFWN
jgi:hypothetical protein